MNLFSRLTQQKCLTGKGATDKANRGTPITGLQTTTSGTCVLLENSSLLLHTNILQQLWQPQSKVLMNSLEAGRSLVLTVNFTDDVDAAVL